MIDYSYKDIRNFYFENELGERIDCQKVNGNLFLYNVTGLGFERNVEYVKIGNSYVKNKDEYVQNVISGDLEFYDMTYDEYFNFVNFIISSKKVKLIYVPKKSNRIEYYRDIDIIKMEQNGEDDYNIMTSPITMSCTSLWYTKSEINYVLDNNLEEEIRWDFRWDSVFSDYTNRTIVFNNNGHVNAPFLLNLKGELINPKIEIFDNNNVKVNELQFPSIKKNEEIIYSTKDTELMLYKKDSNGNVQNLFDIDILDLNKTNFFKLEKGISQIKITADNEILNSKLTIFVEYVAV